MGLIINGNSNRVLIVEKGKTYVTKEEISGLDIEINGNNNLVEIEYPQKFVSCRLKIEGNNAVFSKKYSYSPTLKTFFYLGNGCRMEIGPHCFFNGGISFFAKEKKGVSITLGKGVFVGSDCIVRTGDGHTLVDKNSRDPLNEPQDVRIGNHVWLGSRCMLLKGSAVADCSVVGAMSLVNKKFIEKHVVIAGVPAKIICRDIDWEETDFAAYTEV